MNYTLFLILFINGRSVPNHVAERTIYAIVRQCLNAFTLLRSALEKPGRLYSNSISAPAIDDEIGRFRGWASNLGALKTDRSSLDYRLSDIAFLFDHVTTLLDDLQTSILEGLKSLSYFGFRSLMIS
jgi:hypothetical protein